MPLKPKSGSDPLDQKKRDVERAREELRRKAQELEKQISDRGSISRELEEQKRKEMEARRQELLDRAVLRPAKDTDETPDLFESRTSGEGRNRPPLKRHQKKMRNRLLICGAILLFILYLIIKFLISSL